MEQIIIYVLLVTSVIGLTIIIERALALRARNVVPPEIQNALETCRADGDLPMFRRICEQNPSPLGRLLVFIDTHRQWTQEETINALETRARHEVSRLERGLVILEIVVGIAPLLGLVGTIYGLILLFGGMGDVSSGNNPNLAAGIALALHATLLGLLTAIPSLIAWSYFNKKDETYAIEMAALCEEFLRRQYQEKTVVEKTSK